MKRRVVLGSTGSTFEGEALTLEPVEICRRQIRTRAVELGPMGRSNEESPRLEKTPQLRQPLILLRLGQVSENRGGNDQIERRRWKSRRWRGGNALERC